MKRRDFLLHLISEVSHFVLDGDPSRMVISLHQEEDGLHLAIFDDTPRSDEDLESIRRSLQSTDRPEWAGYYGTMAGFNMLGRARLDLVSGTQIDLWMGGDRFNPNKFSLSEKG
jgi:hypothetical protein